MDVAAAAAAVDAMLAVAECWAASDDARVRNNGAVLRAVVDARVLERATSMWSVKPGVSEPGAFAVPRCGYLHHPSGTPHAVRTVACRACAFYSAEGRGSPLFSRSRPLSSL